MNARQARRLGTGWKRTRTAGLALAIATAAGCSSGGGSGTSTDDIQWTPLEEAHEIINTSTVTTAPQEALPTYKSADDPSTPADDEIPDDVWPDYTPPEPYTKNTTRNLQFNESYFIASPGMPDGETSYVTTSDGYTWGAMSKAINAMWPFVRSDYTGLAAVNAYYAGNLVTTPGPEVVKVTANFKAQDMKFWANENGDAPGTPGAVPLDRYFVVDQWGNEYVMHASGQLDQDDVAQAFADAVLPPGWTKSTRQLDEDLILEPAHGSDGSYHYLVFRDSADNTYHQIGWSDAGSLAAQVEGMPIWGGSSDDVLAGDGGGAWDDLIHGAAGDDVLRPGLGNDEVWGDDGDDAVVLPGTRNEYALVSASEDGTEIVLVRGEDTKSIYYAEELRFDDGSISVKDFIASAS